MKKYLVLVAMTLIFSGCVTTSSNKFDPEAVLDRVAKEKQECRDMFYRVYKSDLSQWVGKSIQEVEDKFMFEGYFLGTRSLDIYGNGWESFAPPDNDLFYESARLTFYFKGGKVYNVVKE